MENILQGLNASQLEAVTSTEGFIRVIAGAGSGKTRALARRFAYLVNEIGILPGNILCVTFTNKSANEMRQRIHNLTGDNDTGYISTFHSFCVSVLQEDSHALQYPKSFLVLDNSDIDSMLKIIYEERGLTLRNMTFSKARDMIEIRKLIKEPEYYLDMLNMSLDTLRQKYLTATEPSDIIFYGYLYQEKKCFGLDYNDLIKFTLYIFEQNEAVKIKWQQRLEYIMIDEFQDIDELQYKLMSVLCGYHKNLFIVGDPDQTIYTWRGANVRYLLDFDKIFPSVKTIMMMQNYRSTPQIVSVVNDLIDKNKFRIKKNLMPTIADGRKVICHHADTSEREAMWIAEQIQALHGEGTSYREITVLYRAHLLMCDKEVIEVQKILPFLSGTWPLCRIGRALGFGQVNLADKAVINLNVLPADAVLVIAALMHDDFLNHLPQEGGGQFLKGKVLSDDTHKLFRIDGGGLRLGKFLLQSGGAVFQFPLFLLIVCRQFHETLVADFAVHIVLIQPLDNAAHFGNALLRLFKLLGGCGGLSLAADLVLLDKQLHKAALMLGGIFRHLPEIGEDTGGQQVGADKVRRTVTGALLVAAADVTVLLTGLVLIPLLVHHMAAVGAEQHTGEQPHFIIAVRAFALLA